jgi:hypothetical protein
MKRADGRGAKGEKGWQLRAKRDKGSVKSDNREWTREKKEGPEEGGHRRKE